MLPRGIERSGGSREALGMRKPLGLGSNLGKREEGILDDSQVLDNYVGVVVPFTEMGRAWRENKSGLEVEWGDELSLGHAKYGVVWGYPSGHIQR